MSRTCPTAEYICRADTSSSLRPRLRSRPRPEATAPDETIIISAPAACSAAIWSTRADMRVVSGVPLSRVSTLLPIFTTMRL